MKKITYILAVSAAAFSLTACSNTVDQPTKAPVETTEAAAVTIELSEIHDAVKDAYGELYIPSSPYDATMFEELFGVKSDLYENYIAEGPMISAHVDNFVAVHAKEGKGEEVEGILNKYRDTLLTDTMQYPMNLVKIQASSVVRHGDYVFFIMLGAATEEAEASGEEAALASTEESNKIALDIIDGFFK